MGLDIYGIKIVGKYIPHKDDDEDYLADNTVNTEHNSSFNFQLGSLSRNTIYNYIDLSINGCHFSYSGYGKFRQVLYSVISDEPIEDMYNNQDYNDLVKSTWKDFNRINKINRILDNDDEEIINPPPFFELLFFSDCEGIINSDVCKKLYKDFIKWDDVAKEKLNSYHYPYYIEFKDMLEDITNNNGSMVFG